jgi:splicing factor 3A subunit 2
MQLFVRTLDDTTLAVDFEGSTVDEFKFQLSPLIGIPAGIFSLELCGGAGLRAGLLQDQLEEDCAFLHVKLKVLGGIDFQHREGSKIGSGGQQSESQAALERKERLRRLALETIDITKDPYIIRNNLGTFECKLCLTVHPNEGNYLAHTQGKRHQYNLGRRAAMEAKNALAPRAIAEKAVRRNVIRIGRPGYKVTKSRDVVTRQRSLTFEVDYPEAEEGCQPRHRFMSAFEQKVEAADKNYQYVLFACDPYETIGFKIPNQPLDKREGRFFTNWDSSSRKFVLQLFFMDVEESHN